MKPLLDLLEKQRVIEISASGEIVVLGVTSRAIAQHAAEIFEAEKPSCYEKASIALAEFASRSPLSHTAASEWVSDQFHIKSKFCHDFLANSTRVGFLDAEGAGTDRLYFNGNLFRRGTAEKTKRVLDSLSTSDQDLFFELQNKLSRSGCVSVNQAGSILGQALLQKLRAVGMLDVHHVTNPEGEFAFITLPSAFHKFNDPLSDDAFDLAKALVAALSYGMTQSSSSRGRIEMVQLLLQKLIRGEPVGPATAIGEDYKVLETKGVIRVTQAQTFGFSMKLLKQDVGQMAFSVLTTGETSSANVLDRPLPGKMTGYTGPELTRSEMRKRQIPMSKKTTYDVLDALRTGEGV